MFAMFALRVNIKTLYVVFSYSCVHAQDKLRKDAARRPDPLPRVSTPVCTHDALGALHVRLYRRPRVRPLYVDLARPCARFGVTR